MVAPDFPNLGAGLSEDKIGIVDDGKDKEEDRVSTIRRVVAPASTSGLSHFQNLAGASLSPFPGRGVGVGARDKPREEDAGQPLGDQGARQNRRQTSSRTTGFESSIFSGGSPFLRKVRNKNDGSLLDLDGAENNDSGDLIVPSNVLFRFFLSPHGEGRNVTREGAGLAEDDVHRRSGRFCSLPSVFSAEMKSGAPGDASAFGSTMDSGPDTNDRVGSHAPSLMTTHQFKTIPLTE